jgi:8-oxo-dGTP pyrophosphatase MutT (NUDIX family)
MSETREAAGLILFTKSQPSQFLLLKHSDRWDLPKGHAEPDESILQTALRETEEETGIAAQEIEVDPDFCFTLQYSVQGKRPEPYLKRVAYFLGRIAQPVDVRLTEHIGYQWFAWPPEASIQAQTIDPLLAEVARHWHTSAR